MLAILRPVVVILREAGHNIMRVDGGRNIRNIATVVVILWANLKSVALLFFYVWHAILTD